MRVGFAGLGRMGQHMARNLASAGHDLNVWNRSKDKAHVLASEIGGTCVDTPADLTRSVDIIVTMLADDPSSEQVHSGEDGLFSVGGAKTFIEMGTMSPGHIADLAVFAPDGVEVIDAPVSGATQAAQEAMLLIMAGCTEAQAIPLQSIFAAMGRQVICLGSCGAGAVMKLAVNSMIHDVNQSLAEALVLAEAAGIATTDAFDVIEASAACSPMLKYRRQLYLDEAAHDVMFTVSLARKDMEITANLARTLGTPMPQGRTTLETLQAAEAAGYAQRDMAAMLAFMREKQT